MQSNYDVIVIGSGPISMVEAIHLARQGQRVVVLEERQVLGGAWYTAERWGITGLEVGCHKIESSDTAYEWIEALGMQLWEMEPQPKLMVRGFPARKHRKEKFFFAVLKMLNQALGMGRVIPYSLHDRLKALGLRQWRRALKRSRYRYFRTGCSELVDTLVRQAVAAGVEIRSNSPAERLTFVSGGVGISSNGHSLSAKRCVLTRNSRVRTFADGEELPLARKHFEGRHFLLKLNGRKKLDFVHLDYFNSGLIRQVTDSGFYSDSEDLILCVNVLKQGNAFQNEIPITDKPLSKEKEKQLIEQIFESLKKEEIVTANSVLLDTFVESFKICNLDGRDLERIAQGSDGRLSALWTADLAIAIARKLPEWKRSLELNPL